MLMKYRITVYVALFAGLLWSVSSFAIASEGKTAMYQLAEIMHRLKHFPSPRGKETLQKIVNNKFVTSNERILAVAMLNLDHRVIAADINNLKSIVNNSNASTDEKALANILLNLNHRPTSVDKKRLKAMMR